MPEYGMGCEGTSRHDDSNNHSKCYKPNQRSNSEAEQEQLLIWDEIWS